MSTVKGKVGTKGQKQIYEENQSTVLQYAAAAAIGIVTPLPQGLIGEELLTAPKAVHATVWALLFSDDPGRTHKVMLGLSVVSEAVALLCMKFMAKASFTEKGTVLDAGLDLNMEGGFGEYCKDVIILMFGVHLLATLSIYAWLLILAVPAYAGFKLWTGIISPWIFAVEEAPEETEADQKRRNKKERKVKRI